MPKYQIQIKDAETNQTDLVETDGVVLLYLEQGKLKVIGKIEIAELAPLLMKLAMEKLASK